MILMALLALKNLRLPSEEASYILFLPYNFKKLRTNFWKELVFLFFQNISLAKTLSRITPSARSIMRELLVAISGVNVNIIFKFHNSSLTLTHNYFCINMENP